MRPLRNGAAGFAFCENSPMPDFDFSMLLQGQYHDMAAGAA
jgi:hypothetical protein